MILSVNLLYIFLPITIYKERRLDKGISVILIQCTYHFQMYYNF